MASYRSNCTNSSVDESVVEVAINSAVKQRLRLHKSANEPSATAARSCMSAIART